MPVKRPALGRGLDSLISMDDTPAQGSSSISDIDITLITPNPDQPRSDFRSEPLEGLAASIREVGVIQPVSLRKTGPDSYQIIAGERRYRAAKMAGLTHIPAYIRSVTDPELTEMALIENLQREDLNPIEIALTLRKLIDQHQISQSQLAERIGRNRSTVTNFLRLLRLPAEVQMGLKDRLIDMGHARALLSIDDPQIQLQAYNAIVAQGISVREVEKMAKKLASGGKIPTPSSRTSHDFDLLRDHLSARFNTKIGLSVNAAGKGKITFPFSNETELEKIIAIFDSLK